MKTACRKTTVIGVLLGLSLLIGGSLLYAHGPFGGPGFGNPEERLVMVSLYLTKKLDLNESQQQGLEVISQELLKKGKALHQSRKDGRAEVVSILRADSVDVQRIQLLQDQNRQTINDFITEVGTGLTQFVSMLSPEQRQTLAGLIEANAGGCPLQ